MGIFQILARDCRRFRSEIVEIWERRDRGTICKRSQLAATRVPFNAEIVEVDAVSGTDVQRLDHHLVDARVGLAEIDLRGLR